MNVELQQSGRHNKLYPSGGDVVDKAADEKSSGQKRIGLEGGDVDSHGLVRVGDGPSRRGPREQRQSASRATPGRERGR
jgi:hypothetical protein